MWVIKIIDSLISDFATDLLYVLSHFLSISGDLLVSQIQTIPYVDTRLMLSCPTDNFVCLFTAFVFRTHQMSPDIKNFLDLAGYACTVFRHGL